MPTYVYECAKCGDEFERYQSFSDEPLKKHPGCGGKVARVFQPVGIVLKGSGFYKNDSRSGGAKRAKSDHDSSKDGDSSKSEKSDAKSETSSESSKTTKADGAKTTEKPKDSKAASTPAAKST